MKVFATIALLCGIALAQSQSGSDSHLAIRPGAMDANEQHVAKEVRHELLMLPYGPFSVGYNAGTTIQFYVQRRI